jgi:hypothetical protein
MVTANFETTHGLVWKYEVHCCTAYTDTVVPGRRMRKVQVHAIRAEDRRQVGCIVLRILKELWCFIAAYQC